MKGLGYIDDPGWVKDYVGIEEKFNISLDICTYSSSLAEEIKRYFHKVYVFGDGLFHPDLIKSFINKVGSNYDLILSPSSLKGRIFSGYASSILNVPAYTDVVDIDLDNGIIERLVYGGVAKAVIKSNPPYVISFVKGIYSGELREVNGEVEEVDVGSSNIKVEFKHRILKGVDPTKADIVIGAGRGFKRKEDLNMAKELAELLGGAWSVTRPLAADYGWCDHWIGISGLVINPKIYLIVGSSGQPHHMLGARGSKIIIAVNKDRDAPVFKEADYGIVGDLYVVLPKLIERLKKLKKE